MAEADGRQEASEADRLLAAAANVVRGTRYCWLMIPSDDLTLTARPMGCLSDGISPSDWTVRFVTDVRSRKVEALRRASVAAITFQSGDHAFVLLAGKVALLNDTADVTKHWRSSFATYFPTDADRTHAAFIEVDVARMELWIRGVTSEPFGMKPTTLHRDPTGTWQVRAA